MMTCDTNITYQGHLSDERRFTREWACKIVESLRSGKLDDEVAKRWHSRPGIDYLREAVATGDHEWMLRVAMPGEHGKPTAVTRLMTSMLSAHKDKPDVRDFFLDSWRSGDIDQRLNVMWRLLDDETLPVESSENPVSHQEVYEFVREHWDDFLDEQRAFMCDNCLQALEKCLADPNFPEAKAWAYLCAAMVVPDRDAVEKLILNYKPKNEFFRRVKHELLELIEPWKPTEKFADLDERILDLSQFDGRSRGDVGSIIENARRLADAKLTLEALIDCFLLPDKSKRWRNECIAMHEHFRSILWQELESQAYIKDHKARQRLDCAIGWASRFAALLWLKQEIGGKGHPSAHPAFFRLSRTIKPHEQLTLFNQYRHLLHSREGQDSYLRQFAKSMRVIQWEVLVHNLPEERFRGRVTYTPVVRRNNVEGYDRDLLWELVQEGWQTVSRGWVPFADFREAANDSLTSVINTERITKGRVASYLTGFEQMLDRLASDPRVTGQSQLDLRLNLQTQREGDKQLGPPFVLQDGELTFFSMLWVFRYAAQQPGGYDSVRRWMRGDIERIPVNFCFDQGAGFCWKNASHERFVTTLGILGPSVNGGWVTTPRCWSLHRWLLKMHEKAKQNFSKYMKPLDTISLDDFAKIVPINRIEETPFDTKQEHQKLHALAKALAMFFLKVVPILLKGGSWHSGAENPMQFIRGCIGDHMPEDQRGGGLFTALLNAGFDEVDWETAAQSTDGRHDSSLVRLCRSPNLPIEYMFRANQPYESHVLMIPQHYRKQETGCGDTFVPTYITFATVVGALPSGVRDDTEHNEQCDSYNDWMGSYILPLTAMADEVASTMLTEITARHASLSFENRIGHDASKVVNMIRGRTSPAVLGAIRTYLHTTLFAASPAQLAQNMALAADTQTGGRAEDFFDTHVLRAKQASSVCEIVDAACTVAGVIHAFGINGKNIPPDTTEKGLMSLGKRLTPHVSMTESLRMACDPFDEHQKLQLYSVLVIAMINTYEHAFNGIELEMQDHAIVIRNDVKPKTKLKDTNDSDKGDPDDNKVSLSIKPWGTESSLRLLVTQSGYRRSATDVVFEEAKGRWVTRIPMPVSVRKM